MTSQELCKCELWWKGPEWLKNDTESWLYFEYDKGVPSKIASAEISNSPVCVGHEEKETSTPCDIKIDRFSSVTKLFQVTALVLRFISILKGDHVNVSLLR